MALTTCPDCRQKCSTEARACPNCGRPLRARIRMQEEGFGHQLLRGGCWTLIILFALFAAFIILILRC